MDCQRKRYWDWAALLRASGEVRSVRAKTGRGAVALSDVPSNERLNELAGIIPARFEAHPLIDADAAKQFLDKSGSPGK